jgi:uncharacterized membrane protein YhaH (DUF805 family)
MFKGRLNRIQYWGCLLLLGVLFYAIRAVDQKATLSEVVIAFISIPRLHDMGKTGWWIALPIGFEIASVVLLFASRLDPEIVIGLVGLTFILFLLVIGIWPGQRGANRFGEPRPGLGFGKGKPAAD